MNEESLAQQLEEDLAWRSDEVRYLRNGLLADVEEAEWPVSGMRAILVMQYAHLEGFTRHALITYVRALNHLKLGSDSAQPHLVAAALVAEFNAMRSGQVTSEGREDGEEGRLMRRARREVRFVERLRDVSFEPLLLSERDIVSMESNLGRDVLQRSLFRVAIPPSEVPSNKYGALEFVKNARNDIAHGSRRQRLEPRDFSRQMDTTRELMEDLARLVRRAFRDQWYKSGSVTVK